MDSKLNLDQRYLMFEDQHVEHVVDSIIRFPGGAREVSVLVSKGLLLFLEGKRELAYPAVVDGLVLSENPPENEMACKMLELCVLAETIEMCRAAEPTFDGSPFDRAHVMWVLMRVYQALYDLYDLGTYLSGDTRRRITEDRAKAARNRLRLDF